MIETTAWTSPKTYTSGAALTASELNTHQRDNLLHLYERVVGYNPVMSADSASRNSATFADIVGATGAALSFPVASGKNYTFMFIATWTHSTTTGGPIFSFDHPGGTARALFEYTGEVTNESDTRNWVTSIDGGSGVATTDTVDIARICVAHGRYDCTTSGTFAMRYARNTAGSITVQAGSSLFVTSD